MDELIPLISIFFVIGVPVMSIAGHFVLRPLVRDIIQAIGGRSLQEKTDLDERLARIEEALLHQGQQVDRLLEAEAFRLRLEGKSD
ncbi:MAG: hypothetical protein ACWGON_11105 [Gemmatimonadota bacterium]